MTLTVLETPKRRVEQSLVEMLRELLKMAEEGEIVEMVAATFYQDGHTGSWATKSLNATKRIGAVTVLLHELCAAHTAEGNTVVGARPDDPAA